MASRKYLNLLPTMLVAATAVAYVGSSAHPAYSASRSNGSVFHS